MLEMAYRISKLDAWVVSWFSVRKQNTPFCSGEEMKLGSKVTLNFEQFNEFHIAYHLGIMGLSFLPFP